MRLLNLRTGLRVLLMITCLSILAACDGQEGLLPSPTATDDPPAPTHSLTATQQLPPASATPGSTVPSTSNPTTPPTSAPTETPTSVPADAPRTVPCPEFLCIWSLENAGPRLITLEDQVEIAYDYALTTRHVLHGHFTERGAGPGNVAVTDLWSFQIDSGESSPIREQQDVVEAVWAPNGEELAYIRATESTYELRWLTRSGEDRLLAADVAFTFSVSPQGDQVAFTRESRYETGGEPGLYIVQVDTGEQQRLSDADRTGFGSISDRPIWSPEGSQILLPVSRESVPVRWLRAAADGSESHFLTFAPHLEQALARKSLGAHPLWHPDLLHLVAQVFPDQLAGLPNQVVLFELDPTLTGIVSMEIIHEGEGELIGWDQPGLSVWLREADNQLVSVPLP